MRKEKNPLNLNFDSSYPTDSNLLTFIKYFDNLYSTEFKRVFMFHEINEELINWLELNKDISYFNDAIFTFDDGLFSQYYYIDHFIRLFPNTPKLFFISTGILCGDDCIQDNDMYYPCHLAHKEFFIKKETKWYMKLYHIMELAKKEHCFIGGHGHNHMSGKILGSLKTYFKQWVNDFELMIEKFNQWFGELKFYCTPYNEYNPLLHGTAKKNHNCLIIGPGRISIEEFRLEIEKEKEVEYG